MASRRLNLRLLLSQFREFLRTLRLISSRAGYASFLFHLRSKWIKPMILRLLPNNVIPEKDWVHQKSKQAILDAFLGPRRMQIQKIQQAVWLLINITAILKTWPEYWSLHYFLGTASAEWSRNLEFSETQLVMADCTDASTEIKGFRQGDRSVEPSNAQSSLEFLWRKASKPELLR